MAGIGGIEGVIRTGIEGVIRTDLEGVILDTMRKMNGHAEEKNRIRA